MADHKYVVLTIDKVDVKHATRKEETTYRAVKRQGWVFSWVMMGPDSRLTASDIRERVQYGLDHERWCLGLPQSTFSEKTLPQSEAEKAYSLDGIARRTAILANFDEELARCVREGVLEVCSE